MPLLRRAARIAFAAALLMLAQAGSAQATTPNNLFDLSHGIHIISHTNIHPLTDVRNLFGGQFQHPRHPDLEVGNLLFADNQPAGFVHRVEWITPTPIELERITLTAAHDTIPNTLHRRGFTTFTLFAQSADGAWEPLLTISPPDPYGSGPAANGLNHESIFPEPRPAQRFRIEVIQPPPPDGTSQSFRPRLVELQGFGQASPAPALTPSNTDLWDITNDIQVSDHSQIYGANPTGMFGGLGELAGEEQYTVFADGKEDTFAHFVEWRTLNPVTIEEFTLFAQHDEQKNGRIRDAHYRGFREFRLFVKDNDSWQQIYNYTAANPFGGGGPPAFNSLQMRRQLSVPVTGQEWRAEFTQFGDSPGYGPRILELDGFGQAVETNQPPAILFVPGLKASRLYTVGDLFETKLWEPSGNADVEKLLLDNNGRSLNPGIYTRDVIDEAAGQNIYKSFLGFLDDLKSDNTITDWQVTPYDWRLPNHVHAPEIITALRNLATDNRPVTIITHSNGALVAKAALAQLLDQNDPLLQQIDRIIYVAAPHHGTPAAVAASLHGYDQQLLGGLLLKTSTARKLAENMPAAFELFPSQAYFETVADPVISFDESVKNLGLFTRTEAVTSLNALRQFVTGAGDSRPQPPADDIITPNILSGTLFDQAVARHASYDTLQLPEHIETVNIIGWGLDTIKGIRYLAKETAVCPSRGPCEQQYELDLRPEFTVEGDETVVNASANPVGKKKLYVDLQRFNNQRRRIDREHGDILEIDELREVIQNIIQEIDELPGFISNEQPEPDTSDKRLRLSVHSPVKLDLYDQQGNHAGLATNQDSDIPFIETQLPNSYYFELGEGKYAGTSFDDNKTVQLTGTGYGAFDFITEEVHGDTAVKSISFTDVPVTPQTVATITFAPEADQPTLQIDLDGNGQPEASLAPGEPVPIGLHWQTAIDLIQSLDTNIGLKVSAINTLETAQRLSENPRTTIAAQKLIHHVMRDIERNQRRRKIPDEAANAIRDILNLIIKGI